MKRTNHPLLRLILVLAAAIILMPVAVLLLWSVTGRWPWPNLLPETPTPCAPCRELLFWARPTYRRCCGAASRSGRGHRRAAEHRHRPAHCPRHRAVLLPEEKPLCIWAAILPLLLPGTVFAMGIQIDADCEWDCPTRWPGSLLVHLICAAPLLHHHPHRRHPAL